ncbi:lipocalin-like domain-containing protein [Amycolatopsis jejuensis]|uniref:lipocalin-like domain-containing protein n=1 Tax=Amycolatopsis jejuensis TaxID=330084 RepID=UPI00052582CF|nr:lipocalin-like domain-containing protein [Amycolatopsis jejuensis]
MTTTHPTLINPADELPASASHPVDSWWYTAQLRAGDTQFWVKIQAMTTNHTCHSVVALLQEPEGHTSLKEAVESSDDVTVSTDAFEIKTPLLQMHGDLDGMEVSGATDDAVVKLALRRNEPVLYNAGAGLFPFCGGQTGQYALPGLTTTGTITTNGTEYQVTGRTWFDRQWATPGNEPPRFTWLGLDLGSGRYLSVWDTSGDGSSWLTALDADGTHTLAGATRTGSENTWELTIPTFDAVLTVTHRELPGSREGLYGGVCTVTGIFRGDTVTGHGYTDVVG